MFLLRIYRIPLRVCCAYTQEDILEVATAVLQAASNEPGVLVEAGCLKGGSKAKLSLLAELAGRELVVFDRSRVSRTTTNPDRSRSMERCPTFGRAATWGNWTKYETPCAVSERSTVAGSSRGGPKRPCRPSMNRSWPRSSTSTRFVDANLPEDPAPAAAALRFGLFPGRKSAPRCRLARQRELLARGVFGRHAPRIDWSGVKKLVRIRACAGCEPAQRADDQRPRSGS